MTTRTLPGPRIGWPLLPLPNADGQLDWPGFEDSVRQMIQVILLTRPGELLMQPDFGAGIQNYVHEPNTVTTRRRIQDGIVESLARWEPRVEVERVDVQDDPDGAGLVRVVLAYRLRRTGTTQVLRASLHLES